MARVIGTGLSYDDVLIVPKYNKISSRKDVEFRTRVTRNHFIDIPLIAANMDTVCDSRMAIAIGKIGGLGVIHRFMSVEEQANQVRKVKEERLLAAAAIGVKDVEERVRDLVRAKVDILVLDIAHGHSKYAGKTIDFIKANYPGVDVMAGNIASKDAAEYFLSKGADAIKVGIGPGSVCTTRIMAGAGVPQITAIMDAFEATKGEIPICADGGIRFPGDVVKALGAGANTVMLGFTLAGTEESPGNIVKQKGKKFKIYRGMASYDATIRKLQLNKEKQREVISVEGEKTPIPFKGPVEPILKRYIGGLASGMTYLGAKEMKNLVGKADFIRITGAGRKKSRAHAIEK
ncbi:guanosine monophosphate reductase [archaeon]|jgi:IMP dehydrogenase|nr:guanosine monophosphate reductase [archaeon]MBT3577880.1 guanosine monophosphate reductase [archaeon]MBT6819756.1 guanosine monophosphate reductase [archaeon]MBT6955963.1 guanosine monophosphate reductase [archaeon]MBT7025538.1 guanosine monophosphate reductase [archaeon]